MTSSQLYPYLAGAALVISILALVLQHVYVRGARLLILEKKGSKPQRSTVLPYESLPGEITNQYPNYHDPTGNYALVRIPVANEGDRAGYMKLLSVSVDQSNPFYRLKAEESVRFSYYSFLLVPAYSAALHTILVRNLPDDFNPEAGLVLLLEVEFGGSTALFKRANLRSETVRVTVELKNPNRELKARLGAGEAKAPEGRQQVRVEALVEQES